MLLLARVVQKRSNEETFAGDHALEPGEQAALHAGLHFDTVFHIRHRPGFRADAFSWVQFDLHQLQVIAKDLIIDHVCHGFFLRKN
jgi:hypothetical protein